MTRASPRSMAGADGFTLFGVAQVVWTARGSGLAIKEDGA